jgi:hypothetical protein
VLGRRENEKRENKTRKPMHVFGLMLVQIHALILSSHFLSYQARHSEMNQCANFVVKLVATSDADLSTHTSLSKVIRDLLKNDTMITFSL